MRLLQHLCGPAGSDSHSRLLNAYPHIVVWLNAVKKSCGDPRCRMLTFGTRPPRLKRKRPQVGTVAQYCGGAVIFAPAQLNAVRCVTHYHSSVLLRRAD